ncbi:HD domain-containing protein [uncultured Sphaerochaeta sp.]|uniref:HD domain-containing protein n=1 Tax=uncultured Sphaerochaeta sp. TaxID=886478 RepID=UPI002A0A7BC5|nr:HD domain-containing protein [uncultured Sphaerochaeta sp.]
MDRTGQIIDAMIEYYQKDVRRINHCLKVYAFAKAIGEMEGLDETTQEILETAALTHDIGIKNSEKKYQSSAGTYQQIEGPPEARILLGNLSIEQMIIDRVCFLIAHHHTYLSQIDLDLQILMEADFLVNAQEEAMTKETINKVKEKIFKTETGKRFLQNIFA